jgi:hypothetical protein
MLKKEENEEREGSRDILPDWVENCLNCIADRQQGKDRKEEIRRTTNVKKQENKEREGSRDFTYRTGERTV